MLYNIHYVYERYRFALELSVIEGGIIELGLEVRQQRVGAVDRLGRTDIRIVRSSQKSY